MPLRKKFKIIIKKDKINLKQICIVLKRMYIEQLFNHNFLWAIKDPKENVFEEKSLLRQLFQFFQIYPPTEL